MACSSREKYGYEDELFEKDVDANFHCPICHNVLNDPKMCRNNEHIFCHDCITEHLRVNSATCPQCQDRLTVETLRRAPRVLINCLSELKMKCDHFDRGCQEFIRLEELASHVKNCGFAPVKCSNEECQMVINKREKIHHETSVCEYRKVKCHSCRDIEIDVKEMKQSLDQAKEEIHQNREVLRREVTTMKAEMDKKLEAVKKEVETMNIHVDEKMEAVKAHVDEKVEALQEDVQGIKENVAEVKHDVVKLTVMISEMLEKFRRLELNNQAVSSVRKASNEVLKDILVAGGIGAERTVEVFCWEKNVWVKVTSMNADRVEASSFVYRDQIFVFGGLGRDAQGTMEIMSVENKLLKWTKFLGSLPYACHNHQTVVYQQRMVLIGGYNDSISNTTGSIFKLHLTPPYSYKLLSEMPKPRMFHRAEIFDDKVLTLGGKKSWCDADALDSVLEFDVNTNECKVMPSLPRAVSQMATVRWKDKVVVMGGRDKKGKVLNDVFTYDCKTGKINALPSMLEKRCGCCAVITGNTIVVIGGEDQNRKRLNSVESLTLGDKTWNYLPAIHEARSFAVAEVLPEV